MGGKVAGGTQAVMPTRWNPTLTGLVPKPVGAGDGFEGFLKVVRSG